MRKLLFSIAVVVVVWRMIRFMQSLEAERRAWITLLNKVPTPPA